MLSIVASKVAEQSDLAQDLDALVREGARRLLLTALKAEVDEYVAQRDAAGTRWWSATASPRRER